MSVQPAIKRVHATDGPLWWCPGVFSPVPSRFVGMGHPSSPRGFPVHDCQTCGEPLFIDFEVDPGVPSWDETEARRLDLASRAREPEAVSPTERADS